MRSVVQSPYTTSEFKANRASSKIFKDKICANSRADWTRAAPPLDGLGIDSG
jgi:hypothetical protein